MAVFHVHVRRTEDITFEVEATDHADAEARYLSDGDEIMSSTDALNVIEIEKKEA